MSARRRLKTDLPDESRVACVQRLRSLDGANHFASNVGPGDF